MHIKQVITSGFRSFRSQSEIEPFSSRHNVIVGRNGSGKSNFFDAIQFVLATSRFNTLRQEERQHLLHEGAGANVMAAFVEVVFDNSDGRMAVDGDEVVLRRTIGLKKDEFFLNRKRVTKTEVTSLLESAGFSKSNPYYIVQQGKVNALCLSKDAERLELLKEVAGTRVYEERREESSAIINESNSKRDKIQEVISYIEERLAELEGEKEELSAYQRCDREKRALEYTIYDNELRRAREQIDSIEAQRSEDASLVHDLHEQVRATQDEIEEQKQLLEGTEADSEKITREREGAERERSRLVSHRAKLEVDVKEAKERVGLDAELQKTLEAQAAKLDEAIDKAKTELSSSVQPRFEAAKDSADQAIAKQGKADLQINELLAKQGRGQRFNSAKDRDAFLGEQLSGLEHSIASKSEGVGKLEVRVEESTKEIKSITKAIKSKETEMKKAQVELASLGKDIAKKTEKRHELAEKRKLRWQSKQEVDDEVRKYNDELSGFQQDFRSSMPKHIAQGLEALDKIVREEKIKGYYGPLVENFQLKNAKYRIPVEVAAGNGLFHVVVEDDEVASRLIARLSKDNLGRVTFMPLKQLSVQDLTYPKSTDVHPLLKVALEYKPQMEKAMQQVFGKKLIARDFETARQFARECNMDALTMDGDEVNRKGALEGGFHDERRSKLKAYLGIIESKAKLDVATKKQQKVQEASLGVDTSVAQVMGEIQREEAKRANLKMTTSQMALELKQAGEDLSGLEERLQTDKTERLPAMHIELEALEAQADSYRNEMGTTLQQTLSASEMKTLATLKGNASHLASLSEAANKELEEAAVERQRLQSLLKDNLLLQRSEIQQKLSSACGDGLGGDVDVGERALQLEQKKRELELISTDAEACSEEIKKLDKAALDFKETIRKSKKTLDDLKNRESRNAEELANAERQTEKQLNKRSMLAQKRDENLRKIQQIGSLPAAEIDEHASDSVKELMKKLHKVNQEMTKYSHVNKKALDQYVNFSEQREGLLERKTELDNGAVAIEELIAALDRQKEEAILRTFKGVSKHFSEVFSELVPQGKGQLIMRTSADAGDDDDDEDEDTQTSKSSSSGPRVQEFEGVQVRVSFTPAGEVYLMSQLSGGQKALVALSMIFAIQRCDPAPFYLFDELDQALDSTYRAAVAAMIQRQANAETSRTQFITTTFRPELVNVASKCYGISLQNKNSNIHALSKGDALSFVADLMNEEEAVGQNSAAPLPRSSQKRQQAEQPEDEEEEHESDGQAEVEDDQEEEEEDEEEDEELLAPKTKRKGRR